MRHLNLSSSQMFLIGYKNALMSDFKFSRWICCPQTSGFLTSDKKWTLNYAVRLKLLQFVSRGQLIKPCTFILHVKKSRSGNIAGTCCCCGWTTMWFRDVAAPEYVCCEGALAVLLLCQDNANAEGLLGQSQEVAVCPCLNFKDKSQI